MIKEYSLMLRVFSVLPLIKEEKKSFKTVICLPSICKK